ncbi:ribonuclease R [Caldovatus aquaticus]|uniref:Ribonuclease R n=1 Tax=Caldovatus aquaticus TaxID=2865671 RepID=A0ABS7EZW8_9PROT|nr:ribonuclease R [Caldovatus aquaticus]MBW8268116.1 ribonuclease R [Caldovatus aquaticus]
MSRRRGPPSGKERGAGSAAPAPGAGRGRAGAPARRRTPRAAAALPTKEELRRFLAAQGRPVRPGEIARAFGLGPHQRAALRDLVRALEREGAVAPAGRRGVAVPEAVADAGRRAGAGRPAADRPAGGGRAARLPEMAVVEVFGTDADGEPLARPVGWQGPGRPPVVFLRPERPGQPALAPGERVLARLRRLGGDRYEGRTFKRIGGAAPARLLGVFEEGRIVPTDRRQKAEWIVPRGEEGGATPGDIVLAEPLPGHGFGPRPARVVEVLGAVHEPRSVSLICIHAHGIPDLFPAEALREAEKARGVSARGREDLRHVPLVTIDGEDARDFDDAVWAEPDRDGGWRLLVAIADVAHYVRPGSHLDREAWARGNSVYFPDRVVPMLPEALSNGWCSLRPGEDRGCLFAEMRFDAEGRKTAHRFGRGLMRSAARLTYEQVQRAADAGDDLGLPGGTLRHLYGAFRALLAARERRGTLELDVPERKVVLDPRGKVLAVVPRPRLDSHRLIEEFMIAANVCAAEELERLRQPCMYRVHDRPSDEKLEGLRLFLGGFGFSLPASGRIHPRDFSAILQKVRGRPEERLVHETILRGQSQAAYSPDNIGHFGLALPRYAHFTSPIRRYADLLVHRALIRGLRLGAGGLEETEAARFPETAEHISQTERRAAAAERDAVDRYLAAYMADRVGATFAARISGVTRFGLFVTVEENGASGFVPLASLPDDRWFHDESRHVLTGRRTGLTFALAQPVEVLLAEATPRTGGMVFHLLQGEPRADATAARRRGGGRRERSRRHG